MVPKPPGWEDDDTRTFLEYGSLFVPDRELQIELMVGLLPDLPGEFHLLDVGCGEGLLAEAVLERFEDAFVHGLDGSPGMLRRAAARCAPYGDRFTGESFDLAGGEWRRQPFPVTGVVSSLALHHLDGMGKRTLFRDLYDLLEPGGVLLIADLIEPASRAGREAAADAWDDAVRQRSRALRGSTEALERFRELEWNLFRHPDPADTPSPLFDQLTWLAEAGFSGPDVYWMKAGHAVYGARKD